MRSPYWTKEVLIVAPPQLKDGHIHSTTTRRGIYTALPQGGAYTQHYHKEGHIHSTTTRRGIYTALPQGGTYTQHYHKEYEYQCIAFIYNYNCLITYTTPEYLVGIKFGGVLLMAMYYKIGRFNLVARGIA